MITFFVFGANESGRHGAGAAKYALDHHGAIWGAGNGPQGGSYGIPTKDGNFRPLPLNSIKEYVRQFLQFARRNNTATFDVTRVGCGLAGYKNEQIAPMFLPAPKNCHFPQEWRTILGEDFQYHDLRG